jgi:hypothetical protein
MGVFLLFYCRAIVYGLPELARFFLLSNNLTAKSALFKHVSPPNMDGLYSNARSEYDPQPKPGGYDGTILYGNFLVVSTALWQQPEVG